MRRRRVMHYHVLNISYGDNVIDIRYILQPVRVQYVFILCFIAARGFLMHGTHDARSTLRCVSIMPSECMCSHVCMLPLWSDWDSYNNDLVILLRPLFLNVDSLTSCVYPSPHILRTASSPDQRKTRFVDCCCYLSRHLKLRPKCRKVVDWTRWQYESRPRIFIGINCKSAHRIQWPWGVEEKLKLAFFGEIIQREAGIKLAANFRVELHQRWLS